MEYTYQEFPQPRVHRFEESMYFVVLLVPDGKYRFKRLDKDQP